MSARKPAFATPQDAENAFYEALERADLEAMMTVWAEDEEIFCVHPGGPRLTGYAAIREAWRRIFDGKNRLHVDISPSVIAQTPFTAVHSVLERIGLVGHDETQAPVVATNVYIRSALGWRLLVHHASPVPPSSVAEPPKTLH